MKAFSVFISVRIPSVSWRWFWVLFQRFRFSGDVAAAAVSVVVAAAAVSVVVAVAAVSVVAAVTPVVFAVVIVSAVVLFQAWAPYVSKFVQ